MLTLPDPFLKLPATLTPDLDLLSLYGQYPSLRVSTKYPKAFHNEPIPQEHIRLPPHIYSSCRIKTSQQSLHPEFGAANPFHCNYRHY